MCFKSGAVACAPPIVCDESSLVFLGGAPRSAHGRQRRLNIPQFQPVEYWLFRNFGGVRFCIKQSLPALRQPWVLSQQSIHGLQEMLRGICLGKRSRRAEQFGCFQ